MARVLQALTPERRRVLVGMYRGRLANMGLLDAMDCVEHLADLVREHEPLREVATTDGGDLRHFARAMSDQSYFGSSMAMCAEGGAQ